MILTAIILAIITIPLTILQVQKQQQIKQRAANEPAVSLQTLPSTANKFNYNEGEVFNVEIRLINPSSQDISGFSGIINYDSNVLELVSFISSAEFEEITKTEVVTGGVDFVVVNPETKSINGDILLGILTFKGKSVGTGEVSIYVPKVTASGIEDSLIVNSTATEYTIVKDLSSAVSPTSSAVSPDCFDKCISTPGKDEVSCARECSILAPTNTPTPTLAAAPQQTVILSPTTTPPFCDTVTPPQAASGCTWGRIAGSPVPANCQPQGGTVCRVRENPSQSECVYFNLSCPTSSPASSQSTSPSQPGSPSQQVSPSQPAPSGNTTLAISLSLEGVSIEKAANNVPKGNPDPKTKTRSTVIELLNANNQVVTTKQTNLTFDSVSGLFKDTVDLGGSFASGNYLLKIKSERYLKRLFPGILNIASGQVFTVPTLILLAGDVNGDNELNVLDYNIFVSCFGPKAAAASCTNKTTADVNDDGNIDGIDYNLFVHSLAIRKGD